MGLMTNYLVKTGNAEEFFNALRTAKAPERFTTRFLKDLEFSSSNDRLYIGVLKGLGFLDDNGVPQQRYFNFLDQAQSAAVLAEAIEDAYADLFAINRAAQTLEVEEVRGKFKTLTQGQKSDNVINWMANTFYTLCGLADWSRKPKDQKQPPPEEDKKPPEVPAAPLSSAPLQLHYNIQIVLPESRDQAVYDALFSSLRRHLA